MKTGTGNPGDRNVGKAGGPGGHPVSSALCAASSVLTIRTQVFKNTLRLHGNLCRYVFPFTFSISQMLPPTKTHRPFFSFSACMTPFIIRRGEGGERRRFSGNFSPHSSCFASVVSLLLIRLFLRVGEGQVQRRAVRTHPTRLRRPVPSPPAVGLVRVAVGRRRRPALSRGFGNVVWLLSHHRCYL